MDTKDKDQILKNLFKDNPGTEVPQEVDIRVRRHLTALRERMEATTGEKRPARVSGWGLVLRYATPAIAFVLIIFIAYLFMPGGDSSRAYAGVVKQFRDARSITYTITSRVETISRGIITVKQEYIFKEPHYFRSTDMVGNYVIQNMGEQKSLTVLPAKKMYIETDYYDAPYKEFQGTSLIDQFRSLPKRADEVLREREMDGHNVRGFRVPWGIYSRTLWVDTETGELVRMEEELLNAPGMPTVMENFRFNIEYDDSFFSLEPPPGFTPVKVAYDQSPAGEQDLINALDFFTSHHMDALFPETLNTNKLTVYLEDINNMKSGKLRGPYKEGMTEAEKQKIAIEISTMLSRGFSFAMSLEPKNWHYAGKGVKRGAADTPVFWYKPDGSETYRVIYADLTVREEDLSIIPDGQEN
jgi:hypothetical protein